MQLGWVPTHPSGSTSPVTWGGQGIWNHFSERQGCSRAPGTRDSYTTRSLSVFFCYQPNFFSLRTGFLSGMRNVVTKAPVFLTLQFLSLERKIIFFQFHLGQKIQGKSSDLPVWDRCLSLDQSIVAGVVVVVVESCGNIVALTRTMGLE